MSTQPLAAQWLVVFTSHKRLDDTGYADMANTMQALAEQQPGFISINSVRQADGKGISVSYWSSLEAIHTFKQLPTHLNAQTKGKSAWYIDYQVEIAKIERSYGFTAK